MILCPCPLYSKLLNFGFQITNCISCDVNGVLCPQSEFNYAMGFWMSLLLFNQLPFPSLPSL